MDDLVVVIMFLPGGRGFFAACRADRRPVLARYRSISVSQSASYDDAPVLLVYILADQVGSYPPRDRLHSIAEGRLIAVGLAASPEL